jgi:glycosyltransferase involved in cell wall biosynthesis
MIDLSIIVPVYNAAEFLRECVDSFYRQGLAEERFEVVLVDDGSTDDSCAVMESLSREHANLRTIHQANQGVSVARNRGIQEAQGEWLLMVDADDVIIPRRLGDLLETALRTKTDIVRGDLQKMRSEEISDWLKAHDGEPARAAESPVMTGEEAYRKVFNFYDGNAVRYLFRREFLKDYDLHFIPGIKVSEDAEFVEHTLLKAGRVIVVNIVFYIYRQQENSCMYTMNERKLMDMNTVLGVMASKHQWPRMRNDTRRCQARNLYQHLSILTWYLTHHRSLYACRQRVMADFRQKVVTLPEGADWKLRLTLMALRHCPDLYLGLRYALTTHKFD